MYHHQSKNEMQVFVQPRMAKELLAQQNICLSTPKSQAENTGHSEENHARESLESWSPF